MARQSNLNKKTQEEIVKILKSGNYIETAAAMVGISKVSLYDWLKRGARERRAREQGQPANAAESKYIAFLSAVEKAQAEAEATMIAVINKASLENWQAAAWKLERKFPARWGRQDRIVEQTEVDDEQRNIEQEDKEILSDEQSKELAKELFRRQRALRSGED